MCHHSNKDMVNQFNQRTVIIFTEGIPFCLKNQVIKQFMKVVRFSNISIVLLALSPLVCTNFKWRQWASKNLGFPADVLPLRYHKLFNFVNIFPPIEVFIKEEWTDDRLEGKHSYTTPPQSVFWIIDKKLETLHFDAPGLKKTEVICMWWGEVQSHATWRHGCIRRKLISSCRCPCWKQHGMGMWVGTVANPHVPVPSSLWEEDWLSGPRNVTCAYTLTVGMYLEIRVKKTLKILSTTNLI
jgi:hypothetical protein